MTREKFLVYLGYLNNGDYNKINDYITDDISAEFFDKPSLEKQTHRELHGRDEYIAFFKTLHTRIKEVLKLGFFVFDGETLIVEMNSEFQALEDGSIIAGDLKKGQTHNAIHWICYNFAPDGRINRVRIAHHRSFYEPPNA